MQNDSRFQYFKRPEDRVKGANACRNYGFELSRGEFVNWVDSDDVMDRFHLEVHYSLLIDELVEASVTEGRIFIDTLDRITEKWSTIVPKNNLIDEMISSKVLWPICCVIWKKTAVNINPFFEDLGSSQEWTFHLIQLINGVNYRLKQKTTFYIRSHQQRIGKDVSEKKYASTFQSRLYVLDKLIKAGQLTSGRERYLLAYVFTAFRNSIHYKYALTRKKIFNFLIKRVFVSYHSFKILKVLFLAYPVYSITGKGNKLFK